MRRNFALSPEQRADARAALQLLEGTGFNLADAARIVAGRKGDSRETSIEEAVDAFLRDAIARQLRSRTVDFYESKLRTFEEAHVEATLDALDRPTIRRWVEGQGKSRETSLGYLRAIRALYRWARRQDPPMCKEDPTEGIQLAAAKSARKVSIFSPAQAEIILQNAGGFTAAAALMLFAGLRPSEITTKEKPPLRWEHINFQAKSIRIPAEIAKTRNTRLLEHLPANLWKWLRICRGEPGAPICQAQTRWLPRKLKDHVGEWPQDACRHSFATYHIAAYKSVERTSLILGHEGRASLPPPAPC